jgi:hypothetical protein
VRLDHLLSKEHLPLVLGKRSEQWSELTPALMLGEAH